MPKLRLNLLGGFELRSAANAPIPLAARKAALLLAYLALHPGRAHDREKLAGMLWGDSAEGLARNSLRQALVIIRRQLLPYDAAPLAPDSDVIALAPDAIATDVGEFESLLDEATPEALERALALYRGDLLEHHRPREPILAEWLVAERQRLRERALMAMASLLDRQLAHGSAEAAIGLAFRILALEPTRESAHRALMRLYARQGRRGAALGQYQACRETLQRELGVNPTEETQRLYRELRDQRHGNGHATVALPPEGAPEDSEPVVRPISGIGHPGDGSAAVDPPLESRVASPERRQLTVMVCDLVDAPKMAATLDPEDLHAIVGTYQATVTGVIARFEGHVAKLMGGGVVAYFGWPQAREDAAERAVQAGVEIVGALAAHGAVRGRPIAVRVGIATGIVVVGDLEGTAEKGAALGPAPQLAAALQHAADPGQVVIAETTRQLVGELFELVDLRGRPGEADAVPAWLVLREATVEGRFEALHGVHEMINREQELALLVDRWQLASDGDGQIVVLYGEPGIGKSRIARELRDRLVGRPWLGIRLQCSPHHMTSALWPVIRHLERAGQIERAAPHRMNHERLAGLFTRFVAEPDVVLPLLAELLGIPWHGKHPALSLAPPQKKRHIFQALLTQLAGLARQQPLLIVLEDAQWLDPTTRELFETIVEDIARLPILMLVTARPDTASLWSGHAHITALTLNRLVGHQVRALVRSVSRSAELPAAVVEAICQRTDGVPLFVEELTRTVVESGVPGDRGGQADVMHRPASLGIPTTLNDSLMARLDRSEAVKAVAQVAACIGREFTYKLLAEVAARPPAELRLALDQLVAARLVFQRGDPPDATYTFKHALVQDAAHQSLLRSRRQQLHAVIARAQAARAAADADVMPEVVAQHFDEAGQAAEAAQWWHKAANLALARAAMIEAAAALNRAEALLAELPRTEQRLRQELLVQAARGRVLITTHGQAAPETGDAFDRALALARELRDTDEVFGVLAGIFVFRMVRADFAEAQSIAERMLAAARAGGDEVTGLMAHRCYGVVRFYRGDQVEAQRSLRRAIGLYGDGVQAPLAERFAYDPKAAALAYLGISLLVSGKRDEAMRCFAQALTHARALGHLVTLANTLAHVGLGLMVAGDAEGVRATSQELTAIAAEHGFPYWLAHAGVQRGWLELGEPAGGAAFEEGIAAYRATGARMTLPALLAIAAAGHLRRNEPARAAALLGEARTLAEETGELWYAHEIARLVDEGLGR